MAYSALPPFAAVAGAKRPKMVLVGEAWGSDESTARAPFVGSSGKLLFELLGEAMPQVAPDLHRKICDQHEYGLIWIKERDEWFEEAGIALTNVLALQPPGNKIEALCGKKKEVGGELYQLPPIRMGHYLRPEFLREIDRLYIEIEEFQPNLIVALGNTASWAVCQATNIGSIRGNITKAVFPRSSTPGYWKVLPTYHPAGVLYQWSWRTIVVADLMKALREAAFADIRRPQRRVLINPSIEEVEEFTRRILAQAFQHYNSTLKSFELSADCETMRGQVKMISFAPSKNEAFVIPFIDEKKPGKNYWTEPSHEFRAWLCVKALCEPLCIRIVGQNFIYDLQYLNPMTVKLSRTPEDTMMLHHSLYPEMQKGLGFLGSIYSNESSWKLMRQQAPDTEKRDE